MKELSLAIPFYNEEKSVSSVIENLAGFLDQTKIDYEIIAVDNGSIDRTGDIIDSHVKKNYSIKKVHVKVNKGYGYGIRQGLNACQGKYIGYLWGDNQIHPSSVVEVFNKLKREDLDLCKVRRTKRTETMFRKIQSKGYNSIMYLLFKIRSNDLNGCPKIFKSALYSSLNVTSNDWFIDAEIMIKCVRKNYKVGDIPVVSEDRKGGKSKVNLGTTLEFIKNILKAKFGGI